MDDGRDRRIRILETKTDMTDLRIKIGFFYETVAVHNTQPNPHEYVSTNP